MEEFYYQHWSVIIKQFEIHGKEGKKSSTIELCHYNIFFILFYNVNLFKKFFMCI